MNRVLVIGLDGLCPDLVEQWALELPHLRGLMERGIYGPLESSVPPVTPVAWTSMISGLGPGHFGFTDFMARTGKDYNTFKLVNSRMVRVPTLFTLLPAARRRVMAIGVPISYPPIAIPGGVCVSCFMVPALENGVTYPPDLQTELLAQTSSPYLLDVSVGGATTVDYADLRQRIKELDRQRFDIALHLMKTRPWDLLFMVCMGTDRIGHYFMHFNDVDHKRHDPDPRHHDAIREHYRYCDERIGELIEQAGPDTVVGVVSDHGLQRLDGKISLNGWLESHGYLHLSKPLAGPTRIESAPVDWSRTRAWARGYGGQIYLNVRGREPSGCVDPAESGRLVEELAGHLKEGLTDLNGERLQVEAIRHDEVYHGKFADNLPDLVIRVEDFRYLSTDQIGVQHIVGPATGMDMASHAPLGFLAFAGPGIPTQGRFAALNLLDVMPTVMDLLGAALPDELDGRPIHKSLEESPYSVDDEARLINRLRALYMD